MKFNPFRPNGFAPRTVFTGRIEETLALEQMLFNTLNNNPQHFILHGERGIGKSSLLQIHRMIATGRIPRDDGKQFNFLVVSLNLDSSDTNETIIRKLGLALRTTCAAQSRGKELLKSAWNLISRFEAAGVKLRDSSGEDALDPMMALTEAYSKTCEDIKSFYDGILVIIDEADTAPSSAHLGSTLKALSERVALSDNNALTIGLAGVSNLVGILRASHESSPRLFTGFQLKPLSPSETLEVIHKSLGEAAEKNEKKTIITKDAEDKIIALSEGYPSFIQEFGYFAFDSDHDWEITLSDVEHGAWKEHGAYAQLGMKYFNHLYMVKIGSDEYRKVLQSMATHGDEWVTKDELRKEAGLKETTLSNALQALLSRGIINQEGKKGYYRLPSKSFAAWIKGIEHSERSHSIDLLSGTDAGSSPQ